MGTRHWIFGIGMPLTLIANGLFGNFASTEEVANSSTIAELWLPLITQMLVGIFDTIKYAKVKH